MREIGPLSAGRWEFMISMVEPGTLEHQQGAKLAVSVYCDGKPFAAYAYVQARFGEGACTEDGVPLSEELDFVDFVFSRQDLQQLELHLRCINRLVRDWHEDLSRPGRDSWHDGDWSLPGGIPPRNLDDGEESR